MVPQILKNLLQILKIYLLTFCSTSAVNANRHARFALYLLKISMVGSVEPLCVFRIGLGLVDLPMLTAACSEFKDITHCCFRIVVINKNGGGVAICRSFAFRSLIFSINLVLLNQQHRPTNFLVR